MYKVNDKWQATERWSFRAARLSQGLHRSLLWGNEDGVAKIGGLSRVTPRFQTGMIPGGFADTTGWPVALAGVQNPRWSSWICPKVQNRIHWRREKKARRGSPFSRRVRRLLIVISLSQNDRIPTSGAGERNRCYVAATERKYLDNAGTTRLGQISLDSSQIFTP